MNAPATLDETDRSLLDRIQSDVPLQPRPFAALGEDIGIAEDDCLQRIHRMRHGEGGVIRQISAIFDTRSLGYSSSLVGCQVPAERLEEAAAIISEHPGVSHNYQREHELNLWYTLGLPPDSRLGLQGTVDLLKTMTGADRMLLLPTLKLYKIGVRFDVSDQPDKGTSGEQPKAYNEADAARAKSFAITDAQRQLIRVLQQDLPIEPRPYDGWAREAGCSVDDFLDGARLLLERRQMRRFSAVLRHRRVGMSANVMVVWQAPEDDVDAIGERLAGFREVSHCYRRPTYPDWPFNLYTMVHAKSRDQVEPLLAQMSEAAGIEVGQMLWSGREFKKQRVLYFTGDVARWEAEHAP